MNREVANKLNNIPNKNTNSFTNNKYIKRIRIENFLIHVIIEYN